MRKLGLIGGMNWVSTRAYCKHRNRTVQQRTSPLASAPLPIFDDACIHAEAAADRILDAR